jgi:hypothetical protein
VTPMQINITTNLEEVRAAIAQYGSQARFAAAVALTRTGQDLQKAIPAELKRTLDNPTDFTTRNSTYLLRASKDNLQAIVGFKDRQARYLALQIAGGTRRAGKGGIKLPGNIQLNAFGNIPRGTIARLKAAAKNGSLGGALAKRINASGADRRKGAAPIQLFYGIPQGKGWKDAPMGIWRRVPPSTPGGKGKLVPVIVFEDTPATYRARFDFLGLAQKTMRLHFADNFATALKTALATAR